MQRRAVERKTQVLPSRALQSPATHNAGRLLHGSALEKEIKIDEKPMAYLGKYRATVVSNDDPLKLGRIVALVPAISETPLSWALPCVPYSGSGVGFFAIPPVGANVWIELEGGDPYSPIWSGGYWKEGDLPAGAGTPDTFVFKTNTVTVQVKDRDGSIAIKTFSDSPISLNGINIEHNKHR